MDEKILNDILHEIRLMRRSIERLEAKIDNVSANASDVVNEVRSIIRRFL